jgi:hypothetical protein
MGYTTDFNGQFKLNKPLTEAHNAYLAKFADTRRMRRDEAITKGRSDPVREAAKLPVGQDGAYFVGEGGESGQGNGIFGNTPLGVIDFNSPPIGQPGLWCRWVPTNDGSAIEWDGGEKFYYYAEWIEYLIAHFLKPWKYVVNGEVQWSGEENGDLGKIIIKKNVVTVKYGRVTYH